MWSASIARGAERKLATPADAACPAKSGQLVELPPGGSAEAKADLVPAAQHVVSRAFRALVGEADLPPIRFHDLRHGAATLSLVAGNEP